ncbi:MAG: F0F1 ATP synthase subunit delta [Candidatus Woesebacteria bacterium]
MTPLPDTVKLSNTVITTQDRQEFLGKVQAAQESVFSASQKTLDPQIQALVSGAPDLGKALEGLRTTLLAAPVVRLTLAFEPSHSLIEKLAETIRAQEGKGGCLLEIETDEAVIAGVMISESGTVLDHTMRKSLDSLKLQPILSNYISLLKTV